MDLDQGKFLQDAAIVGNVESLNEALGKDGLILHRFTAANSFVHTPLHTAAFMGHLDFVRRLLSKNPALAAVLDHRRRSALHLAVEQGHCHLVKDLVDASPEICVAVDGEGRNPLHLAAVKGHCHLVKDLVDASPEMCVAVDRDGRNPLHLAAMKGHVGVAKELLSAQPRRVHEMLSTKDAKDDTVLHLAVKNTQFEVVKRMLECIKKYVVKGKAEYYDDELATLNIGERLLKCMKLVDTEKVEEYYEQALKAINKYGSTALDILLETKIDDSDFDSIINLLRTMGCSRAIEIKQDERFSKKHEALMVVASVIIAMTFQATLNPPGGYWQDTKDGHKAGESVMASNLPTLYGRYLVVSWFGFWGSILTILILVGIRRLKDSKRTMALIVTMEFTVVCTILTYMFGIFAMKDLKKDGGSNFENFVYVGQLVFMVLTGILVYLDAGLIVIEFDKQFLKRIMRWEKYLSNKLSSRTEDQEFLKRIMHWKKYLTNKLSASTEDHGALTKNSDWAISDRINNDQCPRSAIPNNQDCE